MFSHHFIFFIWYYLIPSDFASWILLISHGKNLSPPNKNHTIDESHDIDVRRNSSTGSWWASGWARSAAASWLKSWWLRWLRNPAWKCFITCKFKQILICLTYFPRFFSGEFHLILWSSCASMVNREKNTTMAGKGLVRHVSTYISMRTL